MENTIVKLRLLGVLSLAGFIFSLVLKFSFLAYSLAVVSIISFVIIIFLHIKQSLRNGFLYDYFNGSKEQDSEI